MLCARCFVGLVYARIRVDVTGGAYYGVPPLIKDPYIVLLSHEGVWDGSGDGSGDGIHG